MTMTKLRDTPLSLNRTGPEVPELRYYKEETRSGLNGTWTYREEALAVSDAVITNNANGATSPAGRQIGVVWNFWQ